MTCSVSAHMPAFVNRVTASLQRNNQLSEFVDQDSKGLLQKGRIGGKLTRRDCERKAALGRMHARLKSDASFKFLCTPESDRLQTTDPVAFTQRRTQRFRGTFEKYQESGVKHRGQTLHIHKCSEHHPSRKIYKCRQGTSANTLLGNYSSK